MKTLFIQNILYFYSLPAKDQMEFCEMPLVTDSSAEVDANFNNILLWVADVYIDLLDKNNREEPYDYILRVGVDLDTISEKDKIAIKDIAEVIGSIRSKDPYEYFVGDSLFQKSEWQKIRNLTNKLHLLSEFKPEINFLRKIIWDYDLEAGFWAE